VLITVIIYMLTVTRIIRLIIIILIVIIIKYDVYANCVKPVYHYKLHLCTTSHRLLQPRRFINFSSFTSECVH